MLDEMSADLILDLNLGKDNKILVFETACSCQTNLDHQRDNATKRVLVEIHAGATQFRKTNLVIL